MPRYKVTVKFDRTNPETNEPEIDQVREGIFESESEETAKTEYLNRVRANEPTLTELKETTAEEVAEDGGE